MATLYPDGYRDPEWDGSEKEFREIVLPARIAALTEGINGRYADVLPEGWRFEWALAPPPDAPHQLMPDLGGDEPPGKFFLAPEAGGDD
jgi:hypothetical protein